MKKYIYIIVCLLFVEFAVSAQPEAVFNKVSKHYTLNGDGSTEMRYYKELTLKTHIAMNSLYGETFVVYNPEFQSIKINESYTKQADGTIIKTPDNAFNEVLPAMAADAPAYNHLRELVITHTGLELGATIFLDYTVSTKAGFLPANEFYVLDLYQERSPITDYEISISVPNGKTLYYESKASPAITNENEKTTYKWKLRNISAASIEPFVLQSVVPFFCATTSDKNEAQIEKIISKLPVKTSDCEALAKKLTEGKTTELEKAKAIQKFVVSDIAYCGVPLSVAGKVRTPAEVLKTAYGTFFEKTALFVSMLQAAGLKTETVCIFPGYLKYVGINSLSDMKVKVADEYLSPVSLSPTNMSIRGNRDQIWISDGKTTQNIKIEEQPQKYVYSVDITIDSVENITGSLTDNINVKSDIKETNSLSINSEYTVVKLPSLSKGVDGWGIKSLNTRREKPLELQSLIDEICDYSIVIPSEKRLLSSVYDKTISNAVGKVTLKLTKQDEKVNIRREIKFNKTNVAVEEYAAFRELMNLWNEEKYRTIILK